MINVKEIKQIEGLYKSLQYKNYYAVDVLVQRGQMLMRIRYPYNTEEKARKALEAMKQQRQENIPMPDYKPLLFILGTYNTKER